MSPKLQDPQTSRSLNPENPKLTSTLNGAGHGHRQNPQHHMGVPNLTQVQTPKTPGHPEFLCVQKSMKPNMAGPFMKLTCPSNLKGRARSLKLLAYSEALRVKLLSLKNSRPGPVVRRHRRTSSPTPKPTRTLRKNPLVRTRIQKNPLARLRSICPEGAWSSGEGWT